MAIQFLDKPGKAGRFRGWVVTAKLRGKHFEKRLSSECPGTHLSEDLWHRYQQTRAQYYEARWSMRAAALSYLDFMRTEHPGTGSFRGVGFQGITLGIGTIGRDTSDQCYFQVDAPGKPIRIAITEQQTLSVAWQKAVALWGEVFDIRPKDIADKQQHVPAPEQFKRLRKHLNEETRADLPVGVLHHVFAEQRTELERKKSRSNLKDRPSDEDEFLDVHARLEREISAFMERSERRA
ncbi:hypothetical protein [uncultured Marinobacter sp.]|uniref:hypothetical protein n=1 Tax=uncultured Marinobacter sp. TaxID=187379 RepID=UPI0030D988E4